MSAGSRPGTTLVAVTATTLAGVGLGWCYRFRIQEWVKCFVLPQSSSSDKNNSKCTNKDKEINTDAPPCLPPHAEREMRKEERRRRLLPMLTMNKPMYDNILLQDSQGNPLATISSKKAQWYIQKDLADWVHHPHPPPPPSRQETHHCHPPSSPQSILRLRFQPKHDPRSSDEQQQHKGGNNLYNRSTKANRCVVCGRGEHHNRHYVVPYCYRTLFPQAYKNHLSHDVVLTCFDCHVQAEQYSQQRRTDLERRARNDPSTAMPYLIDRSQQCVAKQAAALIKYRHKLPPRKRLDYEHTIRQWHNLTDDKDVLTDDILTETSAMECTTPNPQYISGPVLVVQPLLDALAANGNDDAALKVFVQEWRAYFVETSQPRFLPTGWDVYNPVCCD